ncbi:MAG: hypothetical protein NTV94_09695, partial [Planctomycetota bacterium]|nr:hypothetical protein [Planctomycetota bacterium]
GTPPTGGGETPPTGGGGGTPPTGGGETPPTGGGGGTPPSGGGETPPTGGGGETPPTGGGGETPPTGGGGEVPPTGGGGSGSGGGVTPPVPPTGGGGSGGGGGNAGGNEPPRTPTASKNTPTRRLGVTRAAKSVTSRPKAKVVSNTTPLKRMPFQVRSLSVPRSVANRTTKVVPLKQPRPTDLGGSTTASVPDDR